MKNLRFDKNGIPVLSRLEIEKRSERMLKFFDESCLIEPQATPLGTISTYLKDEHNVNFVFGADLGKSIEGYQYRGRFHIPTKTIYIDCSLGSNDPRFNFTLAHEIAHFVLHRNIKKSIVKNEKDYEITDTNRDLILDHLQSDNPREWVEWQANKFASSLLLPRTTIGKAVLIKQKELGINRRLGQIYLDRQDGNYQDYNKIMDYLSKLYETSKAAIRIRLRELSILIEVDHGPISDDKGIQSLDSILAGLFNPQETKL